VFYLDINNPLEGRSRTYVRAIPSWAVPRTGAILKPFAELIKGPGDPSFRRNLIALPSSAVATSFPLVLGLEWARLARENPRPISAPPDALCFCDRTYWGSAGATTSPVVGPNRLPGGLDRPMGACRRGAAPGGSSKSPCSAGRPTAAMYKAKGTVRKSPVFTTENLHKAYDTRRTNTVAPEPLGTPKPAPPAGCRNNPIPSRNGKPVE